MKTSPPPSLIPRQRCAYRLQVSRDKLQSTRHRRSALFLPIPRSQNYELLARHRAARRALRRPAESLCKRPIFSVPPAMKAKLMSKDSRHLAGS